MSVDAWNPAADGPFSAAAMQRKLEARGYEVSRYTYAPGTHFPDHTHDVDKIDAVLAGQFRLVVDGVAFVLGPGDSIAVPRGVRHSATVVGDLPVVSLDAVRIGPRPR